jgi:cell wall-associated NlpC family hydrolase
LSSALARVFRSFSVLRTWRSRGVAVSFALVAVGALVMASGAASAAPKPTASQVQQKLHKLNNELQQLDQRYDQVEQQVSSANQQLAVANTAAARYETRFKSMRAMVAQIAATAYEDGSINTPVALLTSSNPQKILDQSSILLELSSDNSAEMSAFLTAARQLANAQASARRVRDGILALKANLAKQKASLNKLINQQQSLLNQLSPAQQVGIGPGGGAPTTGIGAPDPLPDVSQGEKAVAFAFSKIGCPYVFGGTGPCADGYDCSGLTQAAWAAAGVSIPRTSEEQATLPAVPESDLEPGDILEFLGDGHVGIYVGNNMLIDAPQTGENVQEVAFTGWYQENFDGAVRP